MDTSINAWKQEMMVHTSRSEKTIQQYIRDVKQFSHWMETNQRLTDPHAVTVEDAKDYQSDLLDQERAQRRLTGLLLA